MNLRYAAVLLMLTLALPVVLSPTEARAVSVAPGGNWQLISPVASLQDHPTNGVVAFQASFYWYHPQTMLTAKEGLEYVSLILLDAQGQPVAAEVTFDEERGLLIWKSDAALDAGAVYTANLTIENERLNSEHDGNTFSSDLVETFTVSTSQGPAEPVPAPVVKSSRLQASELDAATCGERGPTLELQLEAITRSEPAHYFVRSVTSTDLQATCYIFDETVTCNGFAQAETYCATVTVHSLFDGSEEQVETCVSASEQVEPPGGTQTCQMGGDSGDAGCSVAGVQQAPGAPWRGGLALAMLGLVWGWRRRRAGRAAS